MKNVTISCQQISKEFKEGTQTLQILKDINLVTWDHELILLMGPSGSGKTTLLSIIGGILSQTKGTCLVLDTNINELSEAERTLFRRKNIGFLFQHFVLVPTLTALENVVIPLLLNGTPREQAYEQASQFLTKLGLKDYQHRRPEKLSGGEQQRVALARACIHKPKILLCDEPTSFLDRSRGTQIMQLLQSIKDETLCTILVVTHDPRIVPYADRIFEIEDGILLPKNLNDIVEYSSKRV